MANKTRKSKTYDLEERTLQFAKRTCKYVNNLPRTVANTENGKQLVRSAGSVGANYREANDSLSKKDFIMKIKISRKESKETIFWLELSEPRSEWSQEKDRLIDESTQLMKILGSILDKSREKVKV